ncbi:putative odorant receptor 19b [Scaptodrosophila lebanonensis]|uniref:Odorant receptor n=1 Tax=Drosophila lebanonensis TaxID=7225 RepID=A0A6J2TQF5_DROLE|nr:putative odorant receptor 19b [Scaptodrosophila lebanonensis]
MACTATGLEFPYRMCPTVDSTRAMDYHWLLWRYMGLNPPNLDDGLLMRLYNVHRIVWNFLFAVCFPLTILINCFVSESFMELCENLFVALPDSFAIIKYANLWRVRGQLKQVHQILRRLDGRLHTLEEQAIILSAERQCKRIFKAVIILFTEILFNAGLVVYWSPTRQLLFPSWFPWNWWETRQRFMATLLLQLVGLLMHALIVAGNDTNPQAYLTMVAAHIKALSMRISSLGHEVGQSQEQVYLSLRDCIEDHIIILELMDTLDKSLSLACFFQFFCTAMSQCALGVFIFYIDLSPSKTVFLLFMFLALTMETLIICYAAELVFYEGEQLTIAIYSCNWVDQHLKFRRALLLMLQRSQKIRVVVAANFIPVRMATLLAVFRGAYSMFTLLRNVNMRE